MYSNPRDYLSKEELIQKLQRISKLFDKAVRIKSEIDNFVPQDNYSRKIKVPVFPGKYKDEDERDELQNIVDHTDDDAMDLMGDAYDSMYHPPKPAEPKKPTYKGADTEKSKEKQSKLRLVSNLGLGVAIFFLLGGIVGTGDTPEALPAILIIAALGGVAFIGGRFLGKKEKAVEDKLETEAKAEYDKEIAILNEQYENAMKVYEEKCNVYAPVRQAFLNEYAGWRKIYLDSLAEEEKIRKQIEADRQAAVNKINEEKLVPALSELEEENDLLSKKYLGAIDIIIDLLKGGRADDLKEAINLYEDIVYRERQLQLEREKEEQRKYEAAMKQEAEERHHREQMNFQKEQEYHRQQEAEKQLKQQADQHDREMKMQAERLKQEAAAAKANRIKRCDFCAHKSTCRERYYDGAYNCTGFTPQK